MTSKAQATKAKIGKWDVIKVEGFCTAKEATSKRRGSLWNGRCLSHCSTLEAEAWFYRFMVRKEFCPLKRYTQVLLIPDIDT